MIPTEYLTYLLCIFAYLSLVRFLRYKRAEKIRFPFQKGKRPLSSMTTKEAYNIMIQLQELEFPFAFQKARSIALLKAGGIPSMSKLFAATGQNNRRNAGKRAIDTEILLREVQSQSPESMRYMQAVARMNYLHSRYRKAGKILDEDLLHTLGDGILEIFRVIENDEWRNLSDVEKCAIGIFHRNLGEDMDIPFTPLPSCRTGWESGLHFATELWKWTIEYEKAVAKPVATNDQYVRVYVDSATTRLPCYFITFLRKSLGFELDDRMRTSLCLECPEPALEAFFTIYRRVRKYVIRYLSIPRPRLFAVKAVDENPNPMSRLYNFNHAGIQPWYIKPTFWTIWSPMALFMRILGGETPGEGGDKYHPQGYNLQTIGPKSQEGKGTDEMAAAVEHLRLRRSHRCPFSTIKSYN